MWKKRHDGLSAADYLRNCHGYSRRMLTRLKQGCGSLAVNRDCDRAADRKS